MIKILLPGLLLMDNLVKTGNEGYIHKLGNVVQPITSSLPTIVKVSWAFTIFETLGCEINIFLHISCVPHESNL